MITHRPPKIPQSVLVVIYTADGQVLLLERADRAGFWQSVTGSLDAIDEPPRLAAVREVAEETGFQVGTPSLPDHCLQDWQQANEYEIFPVWRHRYAPGVTHNTEYVFGLCLPQPCTPKLAEREHVGYVWLPWQEAAARCFSPSNAQAIEQLPQRLG